MSRVQIVHQIAVTDGGEVPVLFLSAVEVRRILGLEKNLWALFIKSSDEAAALLRRGASVRGRHPRYHLDDVVEASRLLRGRPFPVSRPTGVYFADKAGAA